MSYPSKIYSKSIYEDYSSILISALATRVIKDTTSL